MNSKNPNCQLIDFLGDLEGVVEKAVASTGVVYTYTYPTEKGASYAFEYKFSSGGAIDAKIELEQSNTKLTSAEEGSAHADYVVPEDAAAFDANVTDANNHIKAYAPAATGFVRLKVTGQGSNAASTKLIRARMSIIQAA